MCTTLVAWFVDGPENDHRPVGKHAGGAVFLSGVSDGTRTRDIQDHNLVLYQLNYTHHGRAGPESLRA
jgi:hypothetical protein